jgi:hypothetical protein
VIVLSLISVYNPTILRFLVTITSTSVALTSADIGQVFEVTFDGHVSTTPLPGHPSEATFTLTSFSESSVSLVITVLNTPTLELGSRTSSIRFDTAPALIAASVDAGGLCANARLLGAYLNGFGNIDVCLTGNPAGSLTVRLSFEAPLTTLVLDKFGVRHQSITRRAASGSPGRGDAGGSVPESAAYALFGGGLLALASRCPSKSS